MTEWDAAIDDPTPGQSGMAFLALVTGLAWLVCAPFDLLASLRKRGGADRHGANQEADMHGAVEGGQLFHHGTASK
jgi:hypothetical protein